MPSLLRITGAAAGLSLVLATAAAAQPDDRLPPPQTAAIQVPAGQVEAAIDQLEDLAEKLLERSGIPGMAVAVVHQGETAYAAGFGVRRLGEDDPVEPGTVFQIASLSKSLSATVVARQVDRGLLAWDTRMRDLLPWFTLSDPAVSDAVTLADLFSHRSGLPDHAGDDLEDLGYDRRTILERLSLLPLGPFRASYAYTNFGLSAAAEAVAEASGLAWEEVAREALYGPLGMENTSSRHADFLSRPNRAHAHVATADGFQPLFVRQPDAQSAAGGVSSSVLDLAIWMAMLLDEGRHHGEEFISAEALLPAITPQVISSPAYAPDARAGTYGYGFGQSIEPSGRVAVSHSGAFYLGAATTFLMIPSLDLGIVVLTNASPIGAAEALAAQFAELAQYGVVTRDWLAGYGALLAPLLEPVGTLVGEIPPSAAVPPAALTAYAGRFHSDYFGEAVVLVQDEKLLLSLGPDREQYPLAHWDGNSFTYAPLGENAPLGSLSEIAFALGDTGAADTMTIEFLDENGLGTFRRAD